MTMEISVGFLTRLFGKVAPHADKLLEPYAPPAMQAAAAAAVATEAVAAAEAEAEAGTDTNTNTDTDTDIDVNMNCDEDDDETPQQLFQQDPPPAALLDHAKAALTHRFMREIMLNPQIRDGYIWQVVLAEEWKQGPAREQMTTTETTDLFKKKGPPIPADAVDELGRELVAKVAAYATGMVHDLISITTRHLAYSLINDMDEQWRMTTVLNLYSRSAGGSPVSDRTRASRSAGAGSVLDRTKTARLALTKLDEWHEKSKREVDEDDHDPSERFTSNRVADLLFDHQPVRFTWLAVDLWRNGGSAFSTPVPTGANRDQRTTSSEGV